jgi:quercetin dioxygenase-like cupin family protein
LKTYSCGAFVLAIAGMAVCQQTLTQAPVPVEQEPHHHVVLKNDSVLVAHVVIPPGEATLYHTHSYDRAAIHLTNNMITFQQLNQPESEQMPAKVGEISASTRKGDPLTHRVRNASSTPFEVIDVELLQRPAQPSTSAAATVAAENPSARVYNWVLAPGASSPQHTHERPYLVVAVHTLQLKMTGPDGKSSSHEMKAGDFHWVDAKATHTLVNDGATQGQIVELELK